MQIYTFLVCANTIYALRSVFFSLLEFIGIVFLSIWHPKLLNVMRTKSQLNKVVLFVT